MIELPMHQQFKLATFLRDIEQVSQLEEAKRIAKAVVEYAVHREALIQKLIYDKVGAEVSEMDKINKAINPAEPPSYLEDEF